MLRAVLVAVLLITPTTLFGATRDVVLTLSPEHPEPGALVRVTATTIGADRDQLYFTWLVDDEVVQEGRGRAALDVTAPELGDSLRVRLVADGAERSPSITIRPARVTLEWEAETSHPPFFIGRPLVGGQGTVRVEAIAEFIGPQGRVPLSDIRFTWRMNGRAVSGASGYGADHLVTRTQFFNEPFTISVIAETRGGQRAAQSVTVDPVSLDFVVYEESPLGGSIPRDITSAFPFVSSEVAFMVYPLYASRPESLTYSWSLNGAPVTLDTGDPRRAVFKKVSAGTGQFEIGVSLESAASFLDLAERTFLLHF